MELNVNCEKLSKSKEEIKKAIKLLMDGNAAHPDGIPAEANINPRLTYHTYYVAQIFSRVLETEGIPTD